MSSSSSSYSIPRPELKEISVAAGQEFMRQVVEFCITNYSDLVEILHLGKVPIDVLEISPSIKFGACIGRKAGSYKTNGVIATVDQPIHLYREELIAEAISEAQARDNKIALSSVRSMALENLFPESDKVSRQKFRSRLASNTKALFQLMLMSWPSVDIQNRLMTDNDILAAYTSQDLIAFKRAFNKFCLNASGSSEVSIVNAEKTIINTKMRALDLPGYVIEFSRAADNLRAVGSLWSEVRIVSTFIKNLNSDRNVFGALSRDFSNKHHAAYEMQKMPLSGAIRWVEDYFKEVVMPEIALKKEELLSLMSVKEVSQKVQQLTKGGRSGGGKATEGFRVPLPVLATLLQEKRKAEEEVANLRKKAKNNNINNPTLSTKDKPKPGVAGAVPQGADPKLKVKCRLFTKPEGCKYGSKCKFSHEA